MERNPGEKQNDRNDRAIRKASTWYEFHLSVNSVAGQFPKIVLLTDDEANRKQAQEEGIVCCSGKSSKFNYTAQIDKQLLINKIKKKIFVCHQILLTIEIPKSKTCFKSLFYNFSLSPHSLYLMKPYNITSK